MSELREDENGFINLHASTYPDARMIVGLQFVTEDGERGRILGQIGVSHFLIEWDDGRKQVFHPSAMTGKSEPEVDALGKRTGKWIKGEGWTFA